MNKAAEAVTSAGNIETMNMMHTEELNQTTGSAIIMYSTAWCPDCWRAKQVMDKMKVPYEEIDITFDPEATELVIRLNRGNRSVPTLVFPDGSVLVEPKTMALVEKLQAWTE
jgi:mycoredoxin